HADGRRDVGDGGSPAELDEPPVGRVPDLQVIGLHGRDSTDETFAYRPVGIVCMRVPARVGALTSGPRLRRLRPARPINARHAPFGPAVGPRPIAGNQ